jgi:membrane protein involved in colicin uptake
LKTAAQANLRIKAIEKAQSGADKGIKAEAEARQQLRACSEQIAKVKAEAAKEIARITAEAADAIARIEAEFETKAAACPSGASDKTRGRSTRKKDARHDAGQSHERGLMEKVDTFLTDRSTVF